MPAINHNPSKKNRRKAQAAPKTLNHLHGDARQVTQGERHPAPARGTHHAALEAATAALPPAGYGVSGWCTLSELKRQGFDPEEVGVALGKGVRANNPFGNFPLRLYPEALVRALFSAREQAHPWTAHCQAHTFGPAGGPGWITMATVRRRGWSSEQVHRLLGGGERRPNPMQGPDLRLYPVTWVEECEYSRGFRFEVTANDFRTVASEERRAQELEASRASALSRLLAGDFVVTDLRDTLRPEGDRYRLRGLRDAPLGARRMANYLRHRTTPYEQVCSGSGENFHGASWRSDLSRKDYGRVNQLVCSALVALYPHATLHHEFMERLAHVGLPLLTPAEVPGDLGRQLRGEPLLPGSRANL